MCRDRIFCTLAEARVFFCKKITATAGKRVFVANIVFSGIISISEKKVRIMSKKANQKAIDAFEYTSNEVRMRKRMIDEKQENMQQYVDNLAEQIVDSESEVIGKAMAERTKFIIR